MSQRPGFPVKLDDARKPASARTTAAKTVAQPSAASKPSVAKVPLTRPVPKPAAAPSSKALVQPVPAAAQPRGVGLDSVAVRERMVQKLAEQGIQDKAVLAATDETLDTGNTECSACPVGFFNKAPATALTVGRACVEAPAGTFVNTSAAYFVTQW